MDPVRWGFLGAGMIAGVLAQAVHDAEGAVLQAATASAASGGRPVELA